MSTKNDQTPKMDKFDATLGLRHRDIQHMLEILSHPDATKANKTKALRVLNSVLPGRQHEADQLGAVEILVGFLLQPPNGLLLNCLVALNSIVITDLIAKKLIEYVPRLSELISGENELPIRREAAKLIKLITEFIGPDPAFLSGSIPSNLVSSVSGRDRDPEFLHHAFGFLSRLANKQTIRVPLIDNTDFLLNLIRSFSNSLLRMSALILASNIAMDPSHRGKIALIDSDVMSAIKPFLAESDRDTRFSMLSLLSLLVVPKDGKQMIATDPEIPDIINNIAKNDPDETVKQAAQKVRIMVSELPIGKAIMGGFE